MQTVNLATAGAYSPDKMKKVNLWQTPRMFCDVYGLEPGQSQAGHVHADHDKIYVVQEGVGLFEVGGEKRSFGPGNAIYVPPGVSHGVSNPGPARLKLLVFVAPSIPK